jgi:hypothetical protein
VVLALTTSLRTRSAYADPPSTAAPPTLEAPAARPATGASDDPRARAEALLDLADRDDEAFAFARAIARYDEARALDPGARRAQRAESRAATLRAHAEADFAPFTELERVRREPGLASDPRAIDDLVRHAETFPPGLVRVEAWVLAAEAYAYRLGRPADADRLLGRVVLDPHADAITTHKASRDRVTLRLARGDLAAAEEAVREAGSRADPRLDIEVRRLARRRRLHVASIAVVAAMLVLAARACVTAARRARGRRAAIAQALSRTWRLALGYALYVGVAGALLATGYERGTGRPFLVFGAALAPLLLLARAWGAAGSGGWPARLARGALCAAAAFGSALLVLESVDPAFLEGMGL